MIRKYFLKLKTSEKEVIRWRSHEVSRIEAFSDALFAFAVTLLIISLEVPHSAHELLEMMKGFIPFTFCFGFLFLIWHAQYRFFRLYGLQDKFTLILNGALLFLVLFYVYPLKFLAIATISHSLSGTSKEDVLSLIQLYNSGFMGIYVLFTLMYWNAYMKREELALSPVEVFETRTYFFVYMYIASVALLTVAVSFLGGRFAGYSMICYGLLGGLSILSAKRDKLFRKKFGGAPVTKAVPAR